jgi:SAM-dependent methyltransferase
MKTDNGCPSNPIPRDGAVAAGSLSNQGLKEVATGIPCRGCGAELRYIFVDLGMTPLCETYITKQELNQVEYFYPLHVYVCDQCFLAQLEEYVPVEEIFSEYAYFSSYADTWVEHARRYVAMVTERFGLGKESQVVEIASNDGYLLQHYCAHGIKVLGIEPARNIACIAREQRGIETIEDFFSSDLAARLAADGRRADVIHANNVLAHVPDLNGVLAGIARLLKDDGDAIIEVPSLRDMIDRLEFDTIYHEHLFYFSLTALDRAFAHAGLTIVDVERQEVHGGSLRIFAQRGDGRRAPDRDGTKRVAAMLDAERAWGVDTPQRYARFQDDVAGLKRKLVELVGDLKRQGSAIAAYGAAAKGTTLLSYCGLGAGELDFVIDRSPVKQGLLTPGTRLPILPPEKLLEIMPDFVLLLVWNFADEVMAQQSEYRRRGGRFIIPVPEPRIV